jgi:hypothetical protein
MVIVKGPGIISDLLIWGPGGFRGVRVICLQRWGLGDPRLSGLERFSDALLAPRLSPPLPPLRKGGKDGGVWSFFPPCEGGTQGGVSSASVLCQVRHPRD